MRCFEVIDRRKLGKPACGLLCYEEETGEFSIVINPDVGTEEVPMLFIPFIERGQREIPPKWALTWVRERIVPPNRQNIGQVLRANGLTEYDELALLLVGEGRCCQDEFMVREVTAPKQAVSYAFVALEPPGLAAAKRSLAASLLAARKAAGMSQSQLADASGIPQAKISRIECGNANPTLETIATLAEVLGRNLEVTLTSASL